MTTEHVDVLVVGAGISGISAAYHLGKYCPEKSFAILEARGAMGGTWDLFRYPGVRSDSDMHTLGFNFTPWKAEDSIADGPRDPRLPARHRRPVRHRTEDPLPPPRRRHRLVQRHPALDGHGRAGRHRRPVPAHLRVPLPLLRLLQRRGGLRARLPRQRRLRRPDRAPPALARRSRLRGQARGGDRQRCHRHHARARHGRGGRARHDAAALTHLRRVAAQAGPHRPGAAQGAPPSG